MARKRTFAYNCFYLGFAAAAVAFTATENTAVAFVAWIAGSVAGWYGIRAFEKLIGRGVTAGFTAAANVATNLVQKGDSAPQGPLQYPPAQPQQPQQPPYAQWPPKEQGLQ